MALVLADRVKETTTTTGTGTITLAGAATGFQSFAAIGNGNTTYYTIAAQTGTEWEVGIGTYTASGTTLSRDTVLASSNAGALVNFSAGTKDVFVTQPSSRTAYVDGTTATFANSGIVPIASGGTNTTAAPTAGAVPYGTGTAYGFTAAGTSGQVLQSNGSSAPTWGSSLDTLPVGSLQYISGEYNTGPGQIWYFRPTDSSTNILGVAYGNGTYVVVGGSARVSTSNNTYTWTARTAAHAPVTTIQAVVYGNNLFAYVGTGGAVATSTDAITWTIRTSGTTSALYALTYGNGLYVYGGTGGVLATSTDAITWTARTSGTTSEIRALTYANGLYVYGGAGGVLATSTDAITWTARTSGTTSIIYGLTYGNGLYVYGTAAGGLATSTDAITWTARTSGTTSAINSLVYGNGAYVYVGLGATGGRGVLATSTDAITWTQRNSATATTFYGVIYANRSFMGAGNGGSVIVSSDAAYPGTKWLIADGSVVSQATYTSLYDKIGARAAALSVWTARTSGTTSAIRALTYGNGLYVYGGNGGVLATSANATTWTARTSGTTSSVLALTYGNGLYVYGGVGGVLATSADGITWTARTSGTTSDIYAITYGNGLYVYGGAGGVLATSTDAITWTARTSGTVNSIFSLLYANGLYLHGSNGSGVYSSTDAITWTQRTNGGSVYTLAYGNGLYVAGGTNTGTIGGLFSVGYRISQDGINWTSKRQLLPNYTLCGVYGTLQGQGAFLFGGVNGSLGVSLDGITTYPRFDVTLLNSTSFVYAATYGNGVYVFAGSGGMLYTSSALNYDTTTSFALPTSGGSPTLYGENNDQLYVKVSP